MTSMFDNLYEHILQTPVSEKEEKRPTMIYEDPFQKFDVVIQSNILIPVSTMERLDIFEYSKNAYYRPMAHRYIGNQCMDDRREKVFYKELKETFSSSSSKLETSKMMIFRNVIAVAKRYYAFNSLENRERLIKLANLFLDYDYRNFQQKEERQQLELMVWGMRMLRQLARNEVDFHVLNKTMPQPPPHVSLLVSGFSKTKFFMPTLDDETAEAYIAKTAQNMLEQPLDDNMLEMGRLFSDEDIKQAQLAYAREIEVQEVD